MPVNASDIKPGVVLRGKGGKTRKVESIGPMPGFINYRPVKADGSLGELRRCWVTTMRGWATSIVPAPSDPTPNTKGESMSDTNTPSAPDDWFADVLAFHRKFGCAVGTTPAVPGQGTVELRKSLNNEEHGETLRAMDAGDLAGIADGVVDDIYVKLGTLISYGIDPRPIWRAVHETNMAKVGGAMREDGKVLKPPGWVAPDVAGILSRQEALR